MKPYPPLCWLLLALALASTGQVYFLRGRLPVEAWLLYAIAAVIVAIVLRRETPAADPGQPLNRIHRLIGFKPDETGSAPSAAQPACAPSVAATTSAPASAPAGLELASISLAGEFIRREALATGCAPSAAQPARALSAAATEPAPAGAPAGLEPASTSLAGEFIRRDMAVGHSFAHVDAIAGLLSLTLAVSAACALPRPRLFGEALLLYGLAGVLLAFIALHHVSLARALRRLRPALAANRREIGLIVLLMAAGVAFRLWQIGYYPPQPGAASDEGVLGGFALRLLNDPTYRPIYAPMGGSVNLYHPIALAFMLVGVNTLALRLPSVIAGILTLLPFYALAREMYGRQVAATCLGLFALSFWHNNMARFAFDWAYMPLFATLTLYFLLRGQRTGNRVNWIVAGISLGAGIYGYAAFRLFPFIIALYVVYQAIFVRGFLRRHAGNVALAAVAFFVVALPNLVVAAQGGTWMGATFPHVIGPTLSGLGQGSFLPMLQRFAAQFMKIVGQFVADWRPLMTRERPLLDPLTSILFLLGLALCVVYFRRRQNFLLASILILSIFVGGALSVGSFSYRFFIIVPFVYLVAGGLLQALLARFAATGPGPLANLGLAAIVCMSGAWNVAVFDQHSHDCQARELFEDRPYDILTYVQSVGPGYPVYIISQFPWHFNLDAYQWLANGIPLQQVDNVFAAIPAPTSGARGVLYIATDPVASVVANYLRSIYPDGVLDQHPADDCTPYSFTAFRVDKATVERVAAAGIVAAHGLRGRYYLDAGWHGAPAYVQTDPPFRFAFNDQQRMSVTWDGTLAVTTPGVYTFTLTTGRESWLLIDSKEVIHNPGEGDHSVPKEGTATLAAGPHAIMITYDRVYNDSTMDLRWTPPGGVSEIVPIEVLQPGTGQ